MTDLEVKLMQYRARRQELKAFRAELDRLEAQHDALTNGHFGVADGRVVTIDSMIDLILWVTQPPAPVHTSQDPSVLPCAESDALPMPPGDGTASLTSKLKKKLFTHRGWISR